MLGGDYPVLVIHTPGHARGHLCFYEERTGALVTGDNIIGLGSVLINPPEGNMRDYLNSLERMLALPMLGVLLGGHGPAVAVPYRKIIEYILHRLEREENITGAIRAGASTVKEIVERVYTDVDEKLWDAAEWSVQAQLDYLRS